MAIRLLRGLHNPGLEQTQCVATIGNFDGVHIGHQAIIRKVVAKAKALSLPAVVIVFEPQPQEFFRGQHAPARLMRFREKFQALSEFDLDYICCLKFDAKLSGLTAEAFIDRILVAQLQVRHLVIGDDFHFGSDRQGDYAMLIEAGKARGFTVENTPTVANDPSQARISSTYIRNLLAASHFAEAEQLLTRPYQLTGRVIHGEQLGRQLGFPTANIALHRVKVPLSGVYAVRLIRENGQAFAGVANIGVKPTVGNHRPALEVHLFDFDSDLYREHVRVLFYRKVRDEQRFDTLEALSAQIKHDVVVAKSYLT